MDKSQLIQQLRLREYCLGDNGMVHMPATNPLAGQGATLLAEYLCTRHVEFGSTEYAGIEQCAENVTLVDIRDWFAGRADKDIQRIVELPMYFQEVKEHVPYATTRINERLEFARKSGFLLMTRDEAFAVVLADKDSGAASMLACFETDENLVPREIHETYVDNLVYKSRPRQIATLNITDVQRELAQTEANVLYAMASKTPSALRIERLKTTVAMLEAHAIKAEPERRASGAIVHRSTGGDAVVYKLTPHDAGWKSYPTSQDASYFYVRVNPGKREIYTYAEGDISHVICEDQRQFWAELQDMAQFFGKHRTAAARGYEANGQVTHYFDSWFLQQGPSVVIQFANNKLVSSDLGRQAPLFGSLSLEHPVVQLLRKSREQKVEIPADAFELDLLSPDAFRPYTCHACVYEDGVDFDITFGDGETTSAMVTGEKMATILGQPTANATDLDIVEVL